ncbi:hypothetical protein [Paraburkholderia sp. HD33-4]|uniref:hypothetical protein n=1 Tax=Paraburkholderia sp. HD33-4 TaxID=2883242 RepID=UPI001F290AC4|nr:hypothetical protein [Paraburkholderia sp. HD33-4]
MKKLIAIAAALSFASGSAFALSANTSANTITGAFSNGTLSGNTNVAKGNLHSLLYAGNTTQIMVHYLPWFDGGMDSGINVNYSNSDPTYVNAFMTDIVSRGIDGVMVDWQGQTDISNTGTLTLQPIIHNYTSLQGQSMKFLIVLDANLLNNTSGSTNTQKVVNAMNYITTQYLSDTAYVTYSGKPVVMDFGLTASSPAVNWATIQSDFPNVEFVHLDNATSPDGFGITDSSGSFAWVTPSDTSLGHAPSLSYLDDFYTRALTHTSQIAVGAAFKGFDANPYAPWDGPSYRYTDQQCGQTWLNTFARINAHFSSAHQLPFLQLETWDDYYEGTPIETGVDNCMTATASNSGRTINVTYSGNTNTMTNIEVWRLDDGSHVTYTNMPASVTVSQPGTYEVKFNGQPGIKTTISSPMSIS